MNANSRKCRASGTGNEIGQRKYFYWPFFLSFQAPFCFDCMSNSQRGCALPGLPALLPYRVYKQDPTHNFTITMRKHPMFFVVYSFWDTKAGCLFFFFLPTVFVLFFRNIAQLIFNMSRQNLGFQFCLQIWNKHSTPLLTGLTAKRMGWDCCNKNKQKFVQI